jgi:hypothetical protein
MSVALADPALGGAAVLPQDISPPNTRAKAKAMAAILFMVFSPSLKRINQPLRLFYRL